MEEINYVMDMIELGPSTKLNDLVQNIDVKNTEMDILSILLDQIEPLVDSGIYQDFVRKFNMECSERMISTSADSRVSQIKFKLVNINVRPGSYNELVDLAKINKVINS